MSNARNISKAESRFVNASGDTMDGNLLFTSSGPIVTPDYINSKSKRVYSGIYTFNGGGTQTVLTLGQGETWLLYAMVYNYGGTDFRHGDFAYVARTLNGTPSVTLRMTTLADFGNSSFTDNGAGGVNYYAGGGNPYTQIYMLRLI